MPDYSTKSGTEIAALIEAKGSKIGTFNQADFRQNIGVKVGTGAIVEKSRYLNKPLGGGYCNGVCLDWIRRVLLSGVDRREAYLTYNYEMLKASRQARTTDKAGKKRTVEETRNRAHQNVGLMADAYALSNSLLWYSTAGQPDSAVEGKDWTKESGRLDVFFDKMRKEASRNASSRRFSSLVLRDSKNSTYSSPTQWLNEFLASGLQPGCVSKIGLGRVGESGHAVAAWHGKPSADDPGAFYLFDPNLGVFSLSKNGLRDAIKILFYKGGGDIPYYDECASETAQRMSYMIFGPPRLVTATPLPPVPTLVIPPPTTGAISSASPTPTVNPLATPTPTVSPTPVATPTPAPIMSPSPIPVNPFSSAPFSLPTPGNNIKPASSAAPKPAADSPSALKADLQSVFNDDGRKQEKHAGKVSADGLGYVRLEQTLIKRLLAQGLNISGPAALKGTAPAGEILQRGTLKKFIDSL